MKFFASPRGGHAAVGGRGFTLIEVLVVVALIAILLNVAVPSLMAYQRNAELRAAASTFMASVQLARAEAMKRGVDSYLVPVTSDGWASGWALYVNSDNTPGLNPQTDTLVMTSGAVTPKIAVVSNVAGASGFPDGYIRFNGVGFSLAKDGSFRGGAIEFAVTGAAERRRVVLNAAGRARLCDPAKDTTADCAQP